MSIPGAGEARGEGKGRLRGRINYLVGSDRSLWRPGVPTFARVRYEQVLPGIDLEYYGQGRTLEFDFLVAPFSDPSRINLRYDGARRIRLDRGDLVIETETGELRQHRPRAYQHTASGRREVAAEWVLGPTGAAFRLGSYDRSLPLVIDPAVNYSTYFGGGKADAITAMAVDAEGWVYLTGTTSSVDFPGTAITPATGSQHAFFAKLHPALTGADSLGFCTWFGGNGIDTPTAIAVDRKGVVYIAGHTTSTNFPVTSTAAQSNTTGATDLFLTKLGVFGDSLVYSTILGGAGNETAGGLAINSEEVAYLSGSTASKDFPVTANAMQKSLRGASDAVVARIDTTLDGSKSLTYSSYFGGAGDDSAAALALETDEIVWIGGTSASADFPKAGRFVTEYPGVASGFLSRLDVSGTVGNALYSTLLGAGGGKSEVRAVAVDGMGRAGAAGVTEASGFPTSTLALRRTYAGGGDAFLTVVNPVATGDAIVYSTLLGGTGRDVANAIAVDPQGNFWVTGSTESSAFPASTDAFQTFGGNVAFLTGINPHKVGVAGLLYSTAIGGKNETAGLTVISDRLGNPYVAGRTTSADFPLGARRYQDVPAGTDDGFLTVFEFQTLPRPQRLIVPTQPILGTGGAVTSGGSTRPAFTAAGVTNAASAVTGPIAPGEIVRITGTNLGPETAVGPEVDSNGKIATVVADVVVTFDGVSAPLLSVSVNEVIAIVPYAVNGRASSAVSVGYAGQLSDPVVVAVVDAAPGIFVSTVGFPEGSGLVTFLATGEGLTSPAAEDGVITVVGAAPVLPVGVRIDGIDANVVSASAAVGRPAGYLLVVAEIPAGVTTSSPVPLVLTVGTATSQAGLSITIP
jgi:uncharacterized protein (TIGR03437 family)